MLSRLDSLWGVVQGPSDALDGLQRVSPRPPVERRQVQHHPRSRVLIKGEVQGILGYKKDMKPIQSSEFKVQSSNNVMNTNEHNSKQQTNTRTNNKHTNGQMNK